MADLAREQRRAWLASLVVGSPVRVSEYNGAPEDRWLERRVERVEVVSLRAEAGEPDRVEALWLDDGGRFARDDGRCLCISQGRRVHLGMNERLEVSGG